MWIQRRLSLFYLSLVMLMMLMLMLMVTWMIQGLPKTLRSRFDAEAEVAFGVQPAFEVEVELELELELDALFQDRQRRS